MPALLVAAAALGALLLVILLRDGSTPLTVPPGSVAAIDPRTNEPVVVVPVGPQPGPIDDGMGSLWVGNLDHRTLTRIDPHDGRILGTIALPATPTGVDVGSGAVWVAHGRSGQLSRVDPTFDRVTTTVDLAGRAVDSPTGGVAAGGGSVWVVREGDALPGRPVQRAPVGLGADRFRRRRRWSGPRLGVVSNSGDSSVQRFDPTTFEEGPLGEWTVGRAPRGIVVTEDAVWVAISGDDVVARIDPNARSIFTIPVGDGPEDVVAGAGAVWVANRLDGTVSRIDPEANEVVETIEVGTRRRASPSRTAVVWLTVQAP